MSSQRSTMPVLGRSGLPFSVAVIVWALGVAPLPTVGEAQVVEWARSAGGTSRDRGGGIAVDRAGNSYVTGYFEDTATFGPFTLTSAGKWEMFVAKYDNHGNVIWARSAGGAELDAGRSIAVDAAGNSHVIGTFEDTATFGPFMLTSAGRTDIFVAKFDEGGNVLWARSAGGTSGENGLGIALDAAGDIYGTGHFQNTATFGPFTLISAGQWDMFVAKYDEDGNVVWVRSAGGISSAGGSDIAVDAAGNSLVTGSFLGMVEFGPFTLTSAGEWDMFVAKYDGDGNVLWARSGGGPAWDGGPSIAVDAAGNAYVTAHFERTATFGPFTLTSAGASDTSVAKYDGEGNVLWARSVGGIDYDSGNDIAADAAGNSYVTGRFEEAAMCGPFTLTSAGTTDIFVAKYDANGNVIWARSAGGTSGDQGHGIALDVGGNTHVTGVFAGTATFGSFTLTSPSSVDLFVAKYLDLGEHVGACCDGNDGTCQDNVVKSECPTTDPQFSWFKFTSCAAVLATGECAEHTGACCEGTTGVCDDDVLPGDCINVDPEDQLTWHKEELCASLDPPCEQHRGACCDGTTGVCMDDVLPGSCTGDQRVWHKDMLCSKIGPCLQHTGACCDRTAIAGGCTDDVFPGECICDKCDWFKDIPCEEIECVKNPIPTVSEWGLVVMTLLLLAGAKIGFRHRPPNGNAA